MREYSVVLTDEKLICIAEFIVALHFSDVKLIDRNNPFGLLATIMFYSGLDEGLKDTLKSLLKDPLKDSRFRATFNDYFKNHEISQIRIAGTKWLSEVLVWEE